MEKMEPSKKGKEESIVLVLTACREALSAHKRT